MYRALYDFRSDDPRILNIKAGDRFTILDSSRDTWWQVQNGLGTIGFVPVNYISKDDSASYNEVVKSIDKSIQAIHTAATSNNGIYSKQQRDNLQKLIQHRKAVTSDPKAAATILSAATSTSSKSRQTSTDSEDVATSDPIHSGGGGDDSSPGANYLVAAGPPPSRSLHRSVSGDCCGGGAGGRHHHHHHHHHRHRSKHRSSSHSSTHSSPSRSHRLCSREVSLDAGPNYNSPPTQIPPRVTNTIEVQCSPIRTSAAGTNTSPAALYSEERGSSSPLDAAAAGAGGGGGVNGNASPPPPPPPSTTTTTTPAENGLETPQGLATPVNENGVNAKLPGFSSSSSVATAPPLPHLPSSSSSASVTQFPAPDNLANDLIEAVRVATSLSYESSKTAIKTVLLVMGDSMPQLNPLTNEIINKIANSKKLSDNIESSHDAVRLQVIFSELASCKDDSQQRSWHLYEDESVILEYLEELASILENANPLICRQIVATENYGPVLTLVLYYQMEPRLTIRLKLLKVFAGLCALDAKIISELLHSVLPAELARDMQAHTRAQPQPNPQSDEIDETQRLTYSALVLTMLLSTGEQLPVHHFDILNVDFLTFLLNLVEATDDDGTPDDQIIDMAVNVILAFNLHFPDPFENPLMRVLADNSFNIKVLTERLALLLNRGEDPVQMFDHDSVPPTPIPAAPRVQHSVVKILADIYSSSSTAGLFYTNDAKVLLDIVLREISDLSSSDAMRSEFLSLLHLILANSNYGDHLHRQDEFKACLKAIALAENEDSSADSKPGRATSIWEEQKFIVDAIRTDFAHWFGDEGGGGGGSGGGGGGGDGAGKEVEQDVMGLGIRRGDESPPIPNFVQGRIETGV